MLPSITERGFYKILFLYWILCTQHLNVSLWLSLLIFTLAQFQQCCLSEEWTEDGNDWHFGSISQDRGMCVPTWMCVIQRCITMSPVVSSQWFYLHLAMIKTSSAGVSASAKLHSYKTENVFLCACWAALVHVCSWTYMLRALGTVAVCKHVCMHAWMCLLLQPCSLMQPSGRNGNSPGGTSFLASLPLLDSQ